MPIPRNQRRQWTDQRVQERRSFIRFVQVEASLKHSAAEPGRRAGAVSMPERLRKEEHALQLQDI